MAASAFFNNHPRARGYVSCYYTPATPRRPEERRLIVGINPALAEELRHVLGGNLHLRPRMRGHLEEGGVLRLRVDPSSRHSLCARVEDGEVAVLEVGISAHSHGFLERAEYFPRTAVDVKVDGNTVRVPLPPRLDAMLRRPRTSTGQARTAVPKEAREVEVEAPAPVPAPVEMDRRRTLAMLLEVDGEPVSYSLPRRAADAVAALCAPYRDA